MVEHLRADHAYALYIHIPFCRRKCAYCAFYSVSSDSNTESLQKAFVERLIEELHLVTDTVRRPFSTIYLGGGDPGMLSLQQVARILQVTQRHGLADECTMEINPGSIRKEHEQLFDLGLNRLSIGVQSLSEHHLQTLGRTTSVEENLEAFDLIKQFRRKRRFRLNIDLMTCIPGQRIDDAIEDIDTVLSEVMPDHISLYNLTIEEGTELAKSVDRGALPVFSEEAQFEMLKACWDHLERSGFHQYEVSNFSLSRESRSHHNEQYWQLNDYIGLGPSAAGTLTRVDGKVVRTTGDSHLRRYIHQKSFSIYTNEVVDKSDLILEFLLVGLRTSDGISYASWDSRIGIPFQELFPHTLQTLSSMEPAVVAVSNPNAFSLNAQGLMLLDAIILTFASELDQLSRYTK